MPLALADRAHASTTVVAHFFDKNHKTFGFLMEREIENATRAMKTPAKPVTCVTGGSKVSDKIMLLETFLDYAEHPDRRRNGIYFLFGKKRRRWQFFGGSRQIENGC